MNKTQESMENITAEDLKVQIFWDAVKCYQNQSYRYGWVEYDHDWYDVLYYYEVLVNPSQDIVDYMSSLLIFKGFKEIEKAAKLTYSYEQHERELKRRIKKIKKLKEDYNLNFKYKSHLKDSASMFIKALRKAGDDPKLYTKVYKKDKYFDKLIECWENNYLSIKECVKQLDLSYNDIYVIMKKFNLRSELDLLSYNKVWPFRERYFFKQEEIDKVMQDPKFPAFKDELEKRKAIRAIKAII